MNRAGKQSATAALRTVLVVNPVFAIVTTLLRVRCFSNVLKGFAKLDVTFTETGKIGTGISLCSLFSVAASFQKYTCSSPGKTEHGDFA